ncbi:MAG: adenylate/guanylate cyclase domain-containing protein [Candidatus Aminicenantia bacterium]
MKYAIVYFLNGEEKKYFIEKDKISLGRLSDNDVFIPDSTVSRYHAEILKVKDGYVLKDLDSKNGSFVNSERVLEAFLKDGDTIALGKFELRFERVRDVRIVEEAEGSHNISTERSVREFVSTVEKRVIEERRAEYLAPLVKLGKNLILSRSLDEILQHCMDSIFELIPADRAAIIFYDSYKDSLIPQITRERGKTSETLTISKTIAMRCVKEGLAILVTDAPLDQRFAGAESILIYGIKSAISVPLWLQNSTIGLIYVDSTEPHKILGNEHMEILSILANYSAIAIEQFRLSQKLVEEMKIRARLERYHSPAVVSRLMELTQLQPSFQDMEVSVLFMDIVGFTSIAEELEPSEVGKFLNKFFSEMTKTVFDYEGTLDKYIGDAIMAIFGAPFPQPDHAWRAVKAGLEMIKKTEEITKKGIMGRMVRIRVGINSGKVVVGDFGSPMRMEYTCIGDTVNVASRIESSIAEPGKVVIGESTYRMVKDKFNFEFLGSKRLEGLRKEVKVWEVIGEK